jgi:hypothetical protein
MLRLLHVSCTVSWRAYTEDCILYDLTLAHGPGILPRHLTLHALGEPDRTRHGYGRSASPHARVPLGASGSSGMWRLDATGSPAWCQASMPPARTETVGKWCSRKSRAALTERPSVCHTVTMGRPRWGIGIKLS